VGIDVNVLHDRSALPILKFEGTVGGFLLIGIAALDKCIEIDGFMPFPSNHFLHQFFIEVLGANICDAGKAQFEVLLEEEIVSSCTLIFYVVLQVALGLDRRETEPFHHCHYFIVYRNLIEPNIDPERVHL